LDNPGPISHDNLGSRPCTRVSSSSTSLGFSTFPATVPATPRNQFQNSSILLIFSDFISLVVEALDSSVLVNVLLLFDPTFLSVGCVICVNYFSLSAVAAVF
jgi:hypothetical protein